MQVEAWPGVPGVESTEVKRALVSPDSQERIDFVLSKLDKYQSYNVTVLCYTSAGNGPRSAPVKCTTKQDGWWRGGKIILIFIFKIVYTIFCYFRKIVIFLPSHTVSCSCGSIVL